jgi:hypothetical protein
MNEKIKIPRWLRCLIEIMCECKARNFLFYVVFSYR